MKITIKQNRARAWIWQIRIKENGFIRVLTSENAFKSAADAADSVALYLRSNH